MSISLGVPQGSVLGPLLFLIYINDLNTAIKHCKVHHFADDTNLLHINDSIKKLNKAVNFDLKNLTNWLNANKFSLNVSETELILFKPKIEKLEFDLKLKLNDKRLYPTESVKYLGIKIDENLTLIDHINYTDIKLREFVNIKILKSIYFSIFDCHLNYANTVWGQNRNSMNQLFILQKNLSVL